MANPTETIEGLISETPTDTLSLWLLNGVHEGDWLPLGADGLVIGREPSARPMRAFHDPKMSREHFRLVAKGAGLFSCIDLKSKNGTFVNGAPARGEVLRPQDVLRAGNTVFVVSRGAPDVRPSGSLIGASPAMAAVRHILEHAAKSDLTVLLLGETGTGKEVAAEMMHGLSGRTGAFVAVNCAAVPEQLIERELFGHVRGAFTGAEKGARGFVDEAHEGTLFFDEVGELPLAVQAKLLRFLEKREYTPVGSSRTRTGDVRIIAATNRDLRARIKSGDFREDLYARLEEIVQTMPPLRDRKEDLGILMSALMNRELARRYQLTSDFVEAAALYAWPRNVRELSKTLKRIPVLDPNVSEFHLTHLPDEISAPIVGRGSRGAAMDRDRLVSLLQKYSGNVRKLAEVMGKPRATIYRWIDRWGIELDELRPGQASIKR